MKLNVFAQALAERGQMELWDDFLAYVDTQVWTKTVASVGTVGMQANTAGGILQLATPATQNASANISTTNAVFKLAAGRPFYFEALINYVEAATNQAGIAVGLSSVTSATLLTDSTGVPNSNFSGMLIYKQTGDTTWRCVSSNGTTQSLNTSLSSSQPTTTTDQQLLAIAGRDVDGSNFEITFFLNGQPLLDATSHRPIKHTVAIASIAAMKPVVVCKAEGGANAETLNLDYVFAVQRRAAFNG